ncbi:MAG: hypothetical protein Q9191_000120 [Dirinaria sp. TL-2023a]
MYIETPRALTYSLRHGSTAPAPAHDVESDLEAELEAQTPPSDKQSPGEAQNGPITRFDDLLDRGLVCDTVVKTLTKDMGLETMTEVQSMTIHEALKGVDLLAQARTGTGKTLAFLIPVLQNIINYDPSLQHRSRGKASRQDIRAIIISPTRELAEQIAVEARKLTRNTGVVVQTAVGGSAKRYHLSLMQRDGCHILVGTPGRLNDILSDPRSGVQAPSLSAFVLDEADRLLDDGFAPEIKNIEGLLPDKRDVDRQTMLYSATVPAEVMGIVQKTMKRDFKFVRTVKQGELQTHEKVPQEHVVVRGLANTLPALLELCKRELARKDRDMPFKAIVYFNVTAEVTLAADTFNNLSAPNSSDIFAKNHVHPLHPARIIAMHGRLTQAQRTDAAESFRRAKSAILFSSDVTARGMDFPNVTHVIQIGAPKTQETYIHRIGRTGRGDKPGEGWIFTAGYESDDAHKVLHDMPNTKNESLETAIVDMSKDARLPEHVASTLTQIVDATRTIRMREKGSAYLATLGYYANVRNKQKLVDALNDRSRYCWGLEETPEVPAALIQKLGFQRVAGIRSFEGRSDMRGFGSSESRESGSGYGARRAGSSYDRQRRPSFRGGGRPTAYGDRQFDRFNRRGNGYDSDFRSGDGGYGRSPPNRRTF